MLHTHEEKATFENLLQLISQKRDQMITMTERFGMGSEKTLECSQELDELIVRYQRMRKLG